MKKRYFGVDVGLTGFISICDVDEENNFTVVDSFKIEVEEKEKSVFKISKSKSKAIIKNQTSYKKNEDNLLQYIEEEKDHFGLLEQITNRPLNSSISMMSLQDSVCVFRCIFESLNIDYIHIPPKTWKNFLNITSDKKQSIELFEKLISENKIKLTTKTTKLNNKRKNHNQIESILISYFFFKYNHK